MAGPNFYSYVDNNPVNFIDPFGLDKKQRGWSFTLEGYWVWGGGVVFGKNPNGRFFVTGRYGYGYGGGLAYNHRGTSPGYDPATNPQLATGLGVYADIGAGVGPFALGASAETGYNVGWSDESGFIQPYSVVTLQPTVEADTRLRLRVGGAVGVQVPLVGIEWPKMEW